MGLWITLEIDQPSRRRTDIHQSFCNDFARRYAKLLPGPFKKEETSLALDILASGSRHVNSQADLTLTTYDWKRLEAYSRNLVDYHLIMDLLPRLAEAYFTTPVKDRMALSALQQALLVGMGLQMKTVEELSQELSLPGQQLLAMLNKSIRKFSKQSTQEEAAGNGKEGPIQDEMEQAMQHVTELKSGTVINLPAKIEDKPSTEDNKKDATKTFLRRSSTKHKRAT